MEKTEKNLDRLKHIIMAVAALCILLNVVIFSAKVFQSNPLEGQWYCEDNGLYMDVEKDGVARVRWPEAFDGADISVTLHYDLDKEEKFFILSRDTDAFQEACEAYAGTVDEEVLNTAVLNLETAYDYEVEQDSLVLTDREYGNQMIFGKD